MTAGLAMQCMATATRRGLGEHRRLRVIRGNTRRLGYLLAPCAALSPELARFAAAFDHDGFFLPKLRCLVERGTSERALKPVQPREGPRHLPSIWVAARDFRPGGFLGFAHFESLSRKLTAKSCVGGCVARRVEAARRLDTSAQMGGRIGSAGGSSGSCNAKRRG